MRRVIGIGLWVLWGLSACAQGSAGGDGGAGGDTGTSRDTGTTTRDTGTVTRDSSVSMTCDDDTHGDACESATDLGSLAEGEMMMPEPGVLPMTGDEDWFRVDFPLAMMSMDPDAGAGSPGGGMPSIELAMNEGDAFRFEVRGTCSTTLGCGDGMSARDVDAWSFVDDQSIEGEEQYTTRDVPWPESAVIRVYRPVGTGDCQRYQLRVTR
jgi:hypothetical protein